MRKSLDEKIATLLNAHEKDIRVDERVEVLAEIIAWLCPDCKKCDFPESIRARLTHKHGSRHTNCGAAQIWMVFVTSGQPVRNAIHKQQFTPTGAPRT